MQNALVADDRDDIVGEAAGPVDRRCSPPVEKRRQVRSTDGQGADKQA